MKIAIKNPAPLGPKLEKWGDYHFGRSLEHALAALGAVVVQHYWPEWNRDDGEDAVVVIRGKRHYVPPADKLSLVWVISHPGTVSPAEIDSYDFAYVASETHRSMLAGMVRTPLGVMRQATDSTLFHTVSGDLAHDAARRREIVFVANSRGVRRNVLQWAVGAGIRPKLVGRYWGAVGMDHLVAREYVENHELPDFYRGARLSLNDHWDDMLYFGAVNNRIFDCLACGLPVLSDDFPELRQVCGDAVLYAHDTRTFWEGIRTYTLHYHELQENVRRLWERIGPDYSFAARAREIFERLRAGRGATDSGARTRTTFAADANPLLTETLESVASPRWFGRSRDLQLLHFGPTPAGTHWLSSHDGINYLSGGFGAGPWHVALSKDFAQVGEDRFDVLLVEDLSCLQVLAPEEKFLYLTGLFKRAKSSGVVAISPEGTTLPFERLGVKVKTRTEHALLLVRV